MKSSYVDRAIKFLDMIFPCIEENLFNTYKVRRAIQAYNIAHKRNIQVMNGAVRCALITSDYVIKWDYNLNALENIGGCYKEVEMYKLAKSEGYAYLLAEVTPVFRNGIQFNIMPRYNMETRKPDIEDLVDYEEYYWLRRHINDLHGGNYTIKNGSLVIVDYACYSDGDSNITYST